MALLLPTDHHSATQRRWAASTVVTLHLRPPRKVPRISPKPSPPSLNGSSSNRSPGRTFRQPDAIAAAASPAESVPLNLSGTMRTLSDTGQQRYRIFFPYNGPKLAHARKSAPSRSAVPNAFQALGRKTRASSTLCMNTGIRSIAASVIKSAPMWP